RWPRRRAETAVDQMRTPLVRTAVFTIAIAAALLVAAPGVPAQTPQPERPAAQPGTPPAKPPGEPPPAPPYSYNAEGRRDPFISLLGRGTDPRNTVARPAGVPGILINEVSLKGIVKDKN